MTYLLFKVGVHGLAGVAYAAVLTLVAPVDASWGILRVVCGMALSAPLLWDWPHRPWRGRQA